MLKMIMGSILLAVLFIGCTSGDWKYVPCNGTNTECGNLDGTARDESKGNTLFTVPQTRIFFITN